MINKATIAHYRSISDASLLLRDINVIVGPNGSGKSNILDAIYFLRDAVVDDLDTAVLKRHGMESIRQWSKFRPFNITLDLDFVNGDDHGNYRVVLASSKETYRILEETGSWFGKSPLAPRTSANNPRSLSTFKRFKDGEILVDHKFVTSLPERELRVAPEELFLTLISRGFAGFPFSIFRQIAQELSSFSKYNIYPNTLRNPQVVSRDQQLAEDGSNLATVLKQINSSKRLGDSKEDIMSGLQNIMPNVIDFLVRSAGGFYVPVLRVKEPNDDVHDFNLSQISDGSLRTLGLLAAFYQPAAPAKIGVEEPEQMIHPGALAVIQEAMDSFVKEAPGRRQLFLTTHSPTLLDLFEPEQIIWARFKQGITRCGHIKERQLNIIKRQLFTAGELLLAEGLY